MEVNQKINLKQKVKGQVSLSNLQTYVIAFVTIGVAGTVGLNIMGTLETSMTQDVVIDSEQDQPSSTLPSNYTLDESTQGDFVEIKEGSVTVVLEDSSAGTNITLSESSDYNVYYDSGNVELQSSPGGVTYDDTSDLVYTDYTAEVEDTETREGSQNATEGLNELLNFLPVIGLVVAAAVVIGLVSGFGSGRSRGRA